MAIHLILFGFFLLIILASFAFGIYSNSKIFVFVAFLLLALSGAFVWTSGGLIIDQRPSDISVTPIVYEDVVYGMDDPIVYTFSVLAVLIGSLLAIVTGLVYSTNYSSGNNPFGW